jgi:hypothetical protein
MTVSAVVALKFLAILGALVWYTRRISRRDSGGESGGEAGADAPPSRHDVP